MSVGIPATHHDTVIFNPPIAKYAGQHNKPKNNPYVLDITLQNHIDLLFRHMYTTNTNIVHI